MPRSLRDRLRGPWRVAVTEGSMAPAILPGDWLIVNPLVSRWPGPGAVVVFREPLGETLAIKRVAARGGAQVPFAGGYLTLAQNEAWVTADADAKAAAAVGFGPPIDSTRFGPVADEGLVGRVVFRYAPLRRLGGLCAVRRVAGLAVAVLVGCSPVASPAPGSPSGTTAATAAPASQEAVTSPSAPAPTPPGLSDRPLVWLAPLPPMPTGPGREYTGSDDFMDLFATDSPWPAAAARVGVFKLYGEWVAYHATDAELRAAVAGIAARGQALAVEMGPLDPPAECGSGVESFAGLDEAALISDRLRAVGGTLQVVALDEPWYFAHVYDGPRACQWSVDRVAGAVAGFTRAMRAAWPGIVVGDTEPTPHPVEAAGIAAWLAAYRAAAGEAFGFLHLDIDWSRPDWASMAHDVAVEALGHDVPFGVIYNGGAATTDAGWLRLAGQRVLDYATNTSDPDHVVFQSWMDKPDRVLPETEKLTFTALIDRYAAARETLGNPLGTGPNPLIPVASDASSSIADSPPVNATDGIADTVWSSGGGPPAWIELDFGAAIEIATIRLLVAQSPSGPTDHRVSCRPSATAAFFGLGGLAGSTSDLDELTLRLPSPATCRIVRIRTVASPSWVAWREIEVYPAG